MRPRRELRRMRDHDHRDARPVDLLQQLENAPRHLGIQVAGGLVGEQDPRLTDQRAGDRHSLLLSAAQLVRQRMHARSQAHLVDHAVDAAAPLPGGEIPVSQRQRDVVADVEVRDEIEALEDEAELLVAERRPLPIRQRHHVMAVQAVAAAVEVVEQTRHVQERRLARSGRPHDGDELAGEDPQRKAA